LGALGFGPSGQGAVWLFRGFLADTGQCQRRGHPGASIYEATCNCQFVQNYKYGIGPRIGVAYQINAKTVLRAGWGLVYAPPADIAINS
jgi:hypothetical protein